MAMPTRPYTPSIPLRNTVREHRLRRGFTIRRLAALSNVNHGLIYRLEKGLGSVSDSAKVRLADALGVPIGVLFYPDFVYKPSTDATAEKVAS
jgi:transcriptional regulator with XRE-family HTH domain